MGNPIPAQTRSIDAFSSYDSNVTNRLTRMISDGSDCIVFPNAIDVTINDSTSVITTEGNCIKDDVFIEISDITIDLTDLDFYVQPSGGVWNEIGYYYVLLHYVYAKTRPAPHAEIKLLLPSQRATLFNSEYLFLACLSVSAPGGIYQVDEVLPNDPDTPANARTMAGSPAGGGEIANYKNITSGPYTATPTDKNLKVTGNTVINLPLTEDSVEQLRIIKADAAPNVITVNASGSDTIDNNASIQITQQWSEITLLPNKDDGVWIEI